MFETQKTVTVNARKFDGKIYRSWRARFAAKKGSLLIFVGEFEEDVEHSQIGFIRRGTVSREYYWLDRFYNIFRFQETDGTLKNFYCNINLPPKFHNSVLDYVDLDIDVLVFRNFKYEILDLDDFAENAKKYRYPKELIKSAKENLKELIKLIENRNFPFDSNT